MPLPPAQRPNLNRLQRDVEQMSQVTASGDLGFGQSGGGNQTLDCSQRPIWAIINAQPDATKNAYGFTRSDDGKGDGTYPALAGTTETSDGSLTSGNLIAWEVNGRKDVPVDGSVVVRLEPNRCGPGFTFSYSAGTSPPPPPPPPPGSGCAWLAGIGPEDCFRATVLSASGKCQNISQEQRIILTWDSGSSTWLSGENFNYDGGSGAIALSITADGLPKVTIGTVAGVLDGCGQDGSNEYVDFGFGGPTLCNTGVTGTGCGSNFFLLRIECHSCAIRPGWSPSLDLSNTQMTTLCNTYFGTGNGYSGLHGTPVQVTTAADLDNCDVYFLFLSEDDVNPLFLPSTSRPSDADIAAWIASGGRILLRVDEQFTSSPSNQVTWTNTFLGSIGVGVSVGGFTFDTGSMPGSPCYWPAKAGPAAIASGVTPLGYRDVPTGGTFYFWFNTSGTGSAVAVATATGSPVANNPLMVTESFDNGAGDFGGAALIDSWALFTSGSCLTSYKTILRNYRDILNPGA